MSETSTPTPSKWKVRLIQILAVLVFVTFWIGVVWSAINEPMAVIAICLTLGTLCNLVLLGIVISKLK